METITERTSEVNVRGILIWFVARSVAQVSVTRCPAVRRQRAASYEVSLITLGILYTTDIMTNRKKCDTLPLVKEKGHMSGKEAEKMFAVNRLYLESFTYESSFESNGVISGCSYRIRLLAERME